MGHQIILVNFYELSTVIFVCPGDTKKLFNGFLLQIVQTKKIPVRFYLFINIEAGNSGKSAGQVKMFAAFLQKRDIETVSIEMNHGFILLQKIKKMIQQIFFSRFGIGKPLDQIPGIIFIVGAADQIQLAPVTGETGGFNIKKEKILQFSDPL